MTFSLVAMAIADSYDAFLCDLDGVVWRGHEFLPGATRALNELIGAGKGICFVTNNPRLPPGRQADLLRAGGVEVSDRQVVTAASSLIAVAADRLGAGAPVLGVGRDPFLVQLTEAGFELLPRDDSSRARAVLLSGHPGFDYDELKVASMLVRDGADLIATSRDPTMPMPDGLWPGSGAILAAIETASGRRATTTGKPEPALFEMGLDRLGRPARVAMIGDRIDSDIAGAQACGLDGIAVTTNPDFNADLAASDTVPEHLIAGLPDLLE